MEEAGVATLDRVFHALADPTRRSLLRRLSEGERSVGQLAEPYAMSLAAVSKHLRVLEAAGLVRRRVRGRTHQCALEPGPLSDVQAWLRHYEPFWRDRLGDLQSLLEAEDRARRDDLHKEDEDGQA